jgi:hypothetical protein
MLLSFGIVINIKAAQFDPNKEIQLPKKNVLIKRLEQGGLNRFVSETKLIEVLDGDKILPINASLIINIYLNAYENEFEKDPARMKIIAEKVYGCVFNGNSRVFKYFGYK